LVLTEVVHFRHDVLTPASGSSTLDRFHRNGWTTSPEYALDRLYQRIVDDLNKLMVAVGLKAA
jgi:hypothetical protein